MFLTFTTLATMLLITFLLGMLTSFIMVVNAIAKMKQN